MLDDKQMLFVECFERQAMKKKAFFYDNFNERKIKENDLVLCYKNELDTRFNKKFISRWKGHFVVKEVYSSGYFQLMDVDGTPHKKKVNGYCLKLYLTHNASFSSTLQAPQSATSSKLSDPISGDGT